MDIKFIGTGGAFDFKYGNSAAIVSFKGKRILIDAGNQVYLRLREKSAIEGLDAILITHFHDDHVGSLSSLILHYNHFFQKRPKLQLLYPTTAWKSSLYNYLQFSLLTPEDYVDFVPIDDVEGLHFIDTFGKHIPDMQTWAYVFDDTEEILAYSGDLGDGETMFKRLAPEKEKGRKIRVFHEMAFFEAPSHVHYKALEKHLDQYAIYGYHNDHSAEPEDNKVPLVWRHPEFML